MPNPTPTRELIEVAQADRDAAADLMLELFTGLSGFELDAQWSETLRRGEDDSYPIVQAFARHRATALRNEDRYKAALEARDDLLCLADCLLMEVLGGFPLDNPSQEFCLAIRKVTGEDHALRKQRAAAALAAFRQALATGAEHAD